MTLVILAGAMFLAVIAMFAVLVVSIRRAERVPMSAIQGKRPGTIARRVLVGFRADNAEDAK